MAPKTTFDWETIPSAPGVYRFLGVEGERVYVGKARNLRRRLLQYRRAAKSKRKTKPKEIVKSAARLEWQVCATALEAELLEIQEIQNYRPRWNVAGAFHFLYPVVALQVSSDRVNFAFTTSPAEYSSSASPCAWQVHGAYRSRENTALAFFALMRCLAVVGHRERKGPAKVGRDYRYAFRKIPEGLAELLPPFFRGERPELLEQLILHLVESADARARRAEVQEDLRLLKRFFRVECYRLRRLRELAQYSAYPVAQEDWDRLKIQASHARQAARELKSAPLARSP